MWSKPRHLQIFRGIGLPACPLAAVTLAQLAALYYCASVCSQAAKICAGEFAAVRAATVRERSVIVTFDLSLRLAAMWDRGAPKCC
jgi:hypothetical protein